MVKAGPMIRLYEYPPSGNCYKIRLLLHRLGIPFERQAVDLK
jgi:glutathione S-transferase